MIRSMTGYGLAKAENDKISVSVEIKSLNSKFLDLNLRLPKEYLDKELECRNLINKGIERGKVTFSLDIKNKTEVKPKVQIQKELVAFYYKELKETAAIAGAADTDLFKVALTMPGAMESDVVNDDNDENWQLIESTINEAMANCTEFRNQEGESIKVKFLEYLEVIATQLKAIESHDPKRIIAIKEKIKQHIEEYLGKEYDTARFEQEMIYYIEKLDINEEKTRLNNHISYFKKTINDKENSGKKLGFIAQEIGREINTIGSKSNDADIQQCVVRMKDELEKIKEQVLNIL